MTLSARVPVTLPEYSTELANRQRAGLRAAALLAAGLLVAFSGLDRATAPAKWLSLLGIRALAAVLLCGIAWWTKRTNRPALWAIAAVVVISGTIEAGVFATGGAQSPYLTSNIAVLGGVGILLPLTWREALKVQLTGLAIALVPLVPALNAANALPFATSASYLFTIAIVAVAGAHLQDQLRRGEHRARIEVARQMGLINLGTLAGGLAHELSNPLTYVTLELGMLRDSARDPRLRDRLTTVHEGVERMSSVLSAMRQGARFSGGDLRSVKIAEQLDQALTLVAQKIKSSRVQVVREYATDAPAIPCQPTLIGQLCVNLILNAVDAMAGRPEPRLTVRVQWTGAAVVLDVEDTGPGVPPELRARIFEPFFTTKGEKGNGLGLWISWEIARIHGGELRVLAGVKGALFRLTLPAEAGASTAISAA